MLLAICSHAFAEGPERSIFAQTSALSVSYAIESNTIRSILSVSNHEEFAVVCNASMKSDNHELLAKQKDTRIEAKTTYGFFFKHRPSVKKIELYLACEPAEKSGASSKAANTNTNTGRITYTPLQEPDNTPQKPVVIENLGNP